jgi:hypothetical protein
MEATCNHTCIALQYTLLAWSAVDSMSTVAVATPTTVVVLPNSYTAFAACYCICVHLCAPVSCHQW